MRRREGSRHAIFHCPPHSLPQDWVWLKPGTRNSTCTWMAEPKHLGALAGKWLTSMKQLGLQLGTPIWNTVSPAAAQPVAQSLVQSCDYHPSHQAPFPSLQREDEGRHRLHPSPRHSLCEAQTSGKQKAKKLQEESGAFCLRATLDLLLLQAQGRNPLSLQKWA